MTRPVSYAPIILAAGVMLTLWGAASTWILSVAGVLALAAGTVRWIRETRNEN
jgi:hypothetical protein